MKVLSVLIIIFCVLNLNAQVEQYSGIPGSKVNYYQDFISFAGEKKTRLDYYVQVPYNAVQFVKTGQGFEAAYSITVSVYDEEKENLITEKVWNEKIIAISFELTSSPDNFNLGSRSFDLAPGVYTISTSLYDKDSKNEYSSENKIVVKQFNSLPSISDIMLISGRTMVEGKFKIIPNVSRSVLTDKNPLSVFFEIYADSTESLSLNYEIINENDVSVLKTSTLVNVAKGSNQIFYDIDSLNLDLGKNRLKIELIDSEGKIIDTSVKNFISRWMGVPITLTDLDKAVEQLIYIASPEDMDYIKKAETRIDKTKRFVGFWKKQDPNPADEYNPIFNEYYNRVAYANESFTTYSLEGWRSDRGMVLIILGAPDNIDRHPFEYYAKPYEVWQYYNLNKQFIFVDNTGFGDYRLDPSTPLYGDLYRFRY